MENPSPSPCPPASGLHHSAPPLRSSSPATSTPSLEQQKFGEIHEEKAMAGEVLRDAHVSDEVLGVPHEAGEVCGELQPHTSSKVHIETLGGSDFWRKKSRKFIWVDIG